MTKESIWNINLVKYNKNKGVVRLNGQEILKSKSFQHI